MGYGTMYDLSIIDAEEYRTSSPLTEVDRVVYDEVFETLQAEVGYDFNYDDLEDSIKWYDHEDNMLFISRRFPQYLFMLDGDGEDSEDRWESAYYKGKSVSVTVMMPPLNIVDLFEGEMPSDAIGVPIKIQE